MYKFIIVHESKPLHCNFILTHSRHTASIENKVLLVKKHATIYMLPAEVS